MQTVLESLHQPRSFPAGYRAAADRRPAPALAQSG